MMRDPLFPILGVITDIRSDTPDVKTFRVVDPEGKKPFTHIPGQCAMLSIPGVGEAMFSITSSPTNTEYMEFSIKKCGCLTDWLHAMEVGQQVCIRGPYGKNFPVEGDLKGKDLLFIAGGIGLAFQIRDDMLDVIGTAEEMGKGVGTDETKNTFVKLYGLEKCEELVRKYTNTAIEALNVFENNDFMIELARSLTDRRV